MPTFFVSKLGIWAFARAKHAHAKEDDFLTKLITWVPDYIPLTALYILTAIPQEYLVDPRVLGLPIPFSILPSPLTLFQEKFTSDGQ